MKGVGESVSRRRCGPALQTRPRSVGWIAVAAGFALAVFVGLGVAALDAAEGGGSISGTVSLAGKPPKPQRLDLSSDPPCLEIAGRKVMQQDLVVGKGGGLANVFVRLEGAGLEAAAGPVPEEAVVIEQRGCIYYPRMAGARAGQTLRVVNGDDIVHNVRSVSEAGSGFNIGQPFAGMAFDFDLVAAEPMMRLRCDMHPWMHAFIGVVDHPWFAVSGEDGRFELVGVPAGEYEVSLWHEKLGSQRRSVTITDGAATTLDLSYPAAPTG